MKTPKGEVYLLIIFASVVFASIGGIMNIQAVLKNDCRMPVKDTYGFESDTHISYQDNSEVKYPYLTDMINLDFLSNEKYFRFSIGDFIIFIGIGNMFFFTIKYSIILIKRRNKLHKAIN